MFVHEDQYREKCWSVILQKDTKIHMTWMTTNLRINHIKFHYLAYGYACFCSHGIFFFKSAAHFRWHETFNMDSMKDLRCYRGGTVVTAEIVLLYHNPYKAYNFQLILNHFIPNFNTFLAIRPQVGAPGRVSLAEPNFRISEKIFRTLKLTLKMDL